MREGTPNPQINYSKLQIGGNIAGAVFALGAIAIGVTGIPMVRYILPAAIVVGGGIALILHFAHPRNPGAPWILPGTKK
jgi:hypothetical protein